ncbi:hypothetical protein [Nocardioides sp. GXZ039]|uniref:hypothetical protein n=1 Tax=Nocardioides sp. GXZ039 TaxID=3136018 RepID=UPI0030F4115B
MKRFLVTWCAITGLWLSAGCGGQPTATLDAAAGADRPSAVPDCDEASTTTMFLDHANGPGAYHSIRRAASAYVHPGERLRVSGGSAYVEDPAGRLVRRLTIGTAARGTYRVVQVDEYC